MESNRPSPVLRALLWAEATGARLLTGTRTAQVIEPFIGYATPDRLILRGRVHAALDHATPTVGQGRLANIRQMLGMFVTREVGGAEVEADGITGTADEEGYIRLEVPRADAVGWVDRTVTLPSTGATATIPVLIPRPTGPKPGDGALIISDIDDTVMKTGAYSLARNLWTTFTGNALTREVFPDAAVLLHQLYEGGERPVFYVSSSPWNLHYFLNAVFERSAVIRGPMFLRDLGLSETKLITGGHGGHKGESIDTILAANPDRPAVLMGDTGQKDAQIYRGVIERHPGRVKAVVLRTPGAGLDADDRRDLEALGETGVTVLSGRSFAGFAEQIEAALRSAS